MFAVHTSPFMMKSCASAPCEDASSCCASTAADYFVIAALGAMLLASIIIYALLGVSLLCVSLPVLLAVLQLGFSRQIASRY